MDWRLLMRRSPNRSMTLVGDVAQTGAAGGARSWGEALSPYVADRWRLEQLTVNYRTPAEIADVADDVLAMIDASLDPPSSVRSTGVPPRAVAVAAGTLVGSDGVLGELVAEERAAVGEGRVAVLVPNARVQELRIALLGEPGARAAAEAAEGEIDDFADPEDLEAPVVVLPVTAAKGLEFDSVVLVEPAEVLAESPRGLNDLYVAITRATQRLTVVHHDELPEALKRLRRG